MTKIKDVKRYLNNITIANDGLLVVRNDDPMSPVRERIVIPRSAIDGLITSLHIKLDHPTYHQMKLLAHRYFFALDLDKVIKQVTKSCQSCHNANNKHNCHNASKLPPPLPVIISCLNTSNSSGER